MPLEILRYDVAVARNGLDLDKALDAGEGDGYDTHRVTVLHADQLVAEQAAPRYGLPALSEESQQKMTWATLWVWCALRRMRVDLPEFPVFKTRVLDLTPIKTDPVAQPTDTTQGDGAESLDPTLPGPGIDSR